MPKKKAAKQLAIRLSPALLRRLESLVVKLNGGRREPPEVWTKSALVKVAIEVAMPALEKAAADQVKRGRRQGGRHGVD